MEPLLPTATAPEERDRGADVAVLPVGAFEQHGPHLPLATDSIIATAIARRIAETYNLMLMPAITIGCSHEHEGLYAGTVSITAATMYHVINDIADSLERAGITKLVLINGHGGNYVLSNIVQQASVPASTRRMALYPTSADWTAARHAAGIETNNHDDMHAGELETSVMLSLFPDHVRPGRERSDHEVTDRPAFLIHGIRFYAKGGVIGDPSLATVRKGESVIDSLILRFAEQLSLLDRSNWHSADFSQG